MKCGNHNIELIYDPVFDGLVCPEGDCHIPSLFLVKGEAGK